MPVRSSSDNDAPFPAGAAVDLSVARDETRRVLDLLGRLDDELRATTRSLDAFILRLERADD
ncbi:hypothetical protein [Patulibacter sp.]|uniref:hypothetical protein n=1 Tax=Patulibacter sp. TaxID=1912859 RepID=UPI00271D73D0|nr:hypothetical protein [Patulibacter sp.]MDO9410199.1 hypothetical protein [Patulibacter sp.]